MKSAAVDWPDARREAAFKAWFGSIAPRHGIAVDTLVPASADASFRRYLRVAASGERRSLIVMDAPPPLEDVRPFVHVAGLIAAAGLHAPQVLECEATLGFLLLEDLGDAPYLDALLAAQADADTARADSLMRDALRALVQFQSRVPADALPPYDEALLARELALFPEWCVQREFGIEWTPAQHTVWQRICRLLIDSALAQPVVAVHRDWMPRNLMVAAPNPGILDFQDAVAGPITYDIASLLRDAFISWDEAQQLDWAVRWWEMARRAGLLRAGSPDGGVSGHGNDDGNDDRANGAAFGSDFGDVWRAVEWMGLQRHLKVLGIFCRLKHRDGKPRYSADLPRFVGYANKVAMRYRPLQPLVALLEPMSGTALEAGFTF